MASTVEVGTPGGMAAAHDHCEACRDRGDIVECECRFWFCQVCAVIHRGSTGHVAREEA